MPGVNPAADEVPVLIKRLDPGLPLPARAHPGDAGADLVAAVDVELAPGQRAVVPTGVAIALPDGYAAFVHPRSGLAARHGVTIVNAPGTVDAGYRGEIRVTMHPRCRAHSRLSPRAARHRGCGVPWRDQGDHAKHRHGRVCQLPARRPDPRYPAST